MQKTTERTVKSVAIGTFKAHQTVFYCATHPELGFWSAKELHELVPPNCNVAYDVIVKIGKLRFIEHRQINEIQEILLKKHAVNISSSEIEIQIDKFIFYVAAVHQESVALIKSQIKAQGGYILHVDATCEGDSPKLISSVDSESGFVLYTAKMNSENKDEIVAFLEKINKYFGRPHAVVSDMSKAIIAAVAEVWEAMPHFLCHFHFLAAIGKLLFEKEHNLLRKALSKAGISGKLKAIKRTIAKNFNVLSIDDIEIYLNIPEKLGQTAEATDMLAYYLILWILDHPSECNGYGFPFDQRYLHFYQRLKNAYSLLEEVKTYYSTSTDNDTIIWKLYHLILAIITDSTLKNTVTQYQNKLAVFLDLRQALGVAPKTINKGLRQHNETTSSKDLKKINSAVNSFIKKLQLQINSTNDKPLRESFEKVKERILLNWDNLFADPFIVDVNGKQKVFFVHRTNNIMEHQFRNFAYACRRIHGNRSVRRNLEKIPEYAPLVENLRNPDYVKLIFENESNIAHRFSKIDCKIIRSMAKKHQREKQNRDSYKVKKYVRQTQFNNMIKSAFAIVAT